VLTYYAVTNAAALTLTRGQRRWPPVIAVVGLVGCVVLITSLPLTAIVTGTAILALGVAVRAMTAR
jgi:basic amino acid/polyamine antiporter, APA family